MASLAKLLISVGADTAGFETDMKRLQRDQKKRFDQMTRDAQTLAKGLGVAFAAAATAMTAIVKKTVDVADHMRDLSQQTGISTEVLSGYAYAAEQSGSSLEALTGGIRKMQRSITDASSGMAEQQRAFERLGLSANELLKLSPDKAFELIADKLSKMENATVKAATAQEIFGRSGASLLPIMNEGAAGIQAMTSRVEELNATISKEFSDNADRFNDNLGDMKLVAQGAAITFTEALLPGLVGFQEYIIKAAVGTNDFSKAGEFAINAIKRMAQAFVLLKGILEAIGTVLVGLVAAVVNSLGALVKPIGAVIEQLGKAFAALKSGDLAAASDALKAIPAEVEQAWRSGLDGVARAIDFIPENIAKIKKETDATIADIEKAFTGAAGPVSDLGDVALETADDFGSLNKALDDARKKYADTKAIAGWKKRLDDVNKTVADAVTLLDELVAAQEEYERSLQSILDTYYPIQAEGRRVGEMLGTLNRALEEGDITADQFNETVRRITAGFNEMASGADTAKEGIDLLAVAMDEGARIIERTIQSMFENIGDSSEEAWNSVLEGFESLMASIAKEAARGIQVQIQTAFGEGGGGFGSIDWKQAGLQLGAIAASAFADDVVNGIFGGADNYGTDYVEIGKQIGTVVGAIVGSFIPVIGTALGAIIGAFSGALHGKLFGKLFGREFGAILGGTTVADISGAADDAQRLRTPLSDVIGISGQGGFGDLNDPSTPGGKIGEAIRAFDQAIYDILKAANASDEFEAIVTALETWKGAVDGSADTVEKLLKHRFAAIIGTMGDHVSEFVNLAEDLEDQIERFAVALSVDQLFKAAPDALTGRTQAEFLAAIEKYRSGMQTIGEAAQEFIALFQQVVGLRSFLADFSVSDLGADFDKIITAQNRTTAQALAAVNNQLAEAILNFDGSIESLQEIAGLVAATREGEIALLMEIDAIQKGINSNLDKLRSDIIGVTQGDASGEQLFNQAQDLIGSITDQSTASDIAGIERQFDSLIRSIAPEDQAFMQAEIIGLIELFRARSNQALNAQSQSVMDAAADTRTLVDDFIIRIGDPLDIIASALEGRNLNDTMDDGFDKVAQSNLDAANLIVSAIQTGMNVTVVVQESSGSLSGGLVTQ